MKLKATLCLAVLASSCSTYMPHDKVAATPPAKMQERWPSSSMDEENLQTTFETLINDNNPEEAFTKYLTTLKSVYAKSEAYLKDFDSELDDALKESKEVNFETSKSYKKLIVMRALSERTQDKITYFYAKLTDIAYDKSQSFSQRKQAKAIIKKFKAQLDSSDAVSKLAFENLRSHIAQALKLKFGSGNKSLGAEAKVADNSMSTEERTRLIRANRALLQNLGRNELSKSDEEVQKIENEADKLQLVEQNSREPQSEKKFYPSTGGNGNIMGLIFPKGTWALTYDDGPSPVHTTKIVSNLNELGIKATFFWLAQNVVQFQSTVDLVGQNGHARADHSWSHPQLPKLSDEGLNKEINKSAEVEAKAYGQKVEYFRCPYGAGNSVARIRQRIADLGMIHVFWNVDTLDWQDKDPDSIVERAKKQMKSNGNHGVILFHDIHPQSVIASKKLVEWTKTLKGTSDEVRWVTIPQIVKEMNGE